jgi:HAD superfamily hydrolase (TIGR01509 family)
MAPVVLFDVLGTLVHDPFPDAAAEVLGLAPHEIRTSLDYAALLDFEEGRMAEAACLERLFVDRRRVDGAALTSFLRKSYRWLPGMEALLAELHEHGIVMHALSDYSEWYRMIDERLTLSRYLPWTFVSCRTGICKPDPQAFAGAARALGIAVEDCLVVDDKLRNCAVARELGMQAIRFESAAALRVELEARALL